MDCLIALFSSPASLSRVAPRSHSLQMVGVLMYHLGTTPSLAVPFLTNLGIASTEHLFDSASHLCKQRCQQAFTGMDFTVIA
jgi:hypothetical protein